MGDVRELSKHRRYHHVRGDGLHAESTELDELEDLFGLDEEEGPPLTPLSSCADCTYRVDRNSFWRRLFGRSDMRRFFCATSPRNPGVNPVTNEKGYLPTGAYSPLSIQPEPHEACWVVNPVGTCKLFRVKLVEPAR